LARITIPSEGWGQTIAIVGALLVAGSAWARLASLNPLAADGRGGAQGPTHILRRQDRRSQLRPPALFTWVAVCMVRSRSVGLTTGPGYSHPWNRRSRLSFRQHDRSAGVLLGSGAIGPCLPPFCALGLPFLRLESRAACGRHPTCAKTSPREWRCTRTPWLPVGLICPKDGCASIAFAATASGRLSSPELKLIPREARKVAAAILCCAPAAQSGASSIALGP